MSSFTREWAREKTRTGTVHRPVIDLLFAEKHGHNLYTFIVDSGADISLAPRGLAERIGLDWTKGTKTMLRGISPEPHCSVEGRIHDVNAILPDIRLQVELPLCFAEGDAPYLIGREGFFDRFKVTLDKTNKRTNFLLAARKKSVGHPRTKETVESVKIDKEFRRIAERTLRKNRALLEKLAKI